VDNQSSNNGPCHYCVHDCVQHKKENDNPAACRRFGHFANNFGRLVAKLGSFCTYNGGGRQSFCFCIFRIQKRAQQRNQTMGDNCFYDYIYGLLGYPCIIPLELVA